MKKIFNKKLLIGLGFGLSLFPIISIISCGNNETKTSSKQEVDEEIKRIEKKINSISTNINLSNNDFNSQINKEHLLDYLIIKQNLELKKTTFIYTIYDFKKQQDNNVSLQKISFKINIKLKKEESIQSTTQELFLIFIVNPSLPDNPNKPNDDSYNQDPNFLKHQSQQFTFLNNYSRNIKSTTTNRTINNNFYNTSLIQKYGEQFKYPGYNFNYETTNELSEEERKKLMKLVMDEVTDYKENDKNLKYNDANFIINEIKNNRLKKHPAQKVFYKQNVLDTAKSYDVDFSISSSMKGLTALGLYAPAGEVISLEFDEKTFELIKKNDYQNGLEIIINDNYWDNKDPGDSGQISNRYPYLETIFKIDTQNRKILFGSPFGGSISIRINEKLKSNNFNPIYPSFENINFTIKGAVESFHYIHGQTTEKEWNEQIKKIKNKEISSPIFSAIFTYASMHIPFTNIDEIGYKSIDKIIFPKEVFDKWFNFLYLSSYFMNNDINGETLRQSFKFCDDIWGGNAAYGGGGQFWAPIEWGSSSFLMGLSGFTIDNSWGIFHEINHNFEQAKALFKAESHPKTNLTNILNLSFLSDTGRRRNAYNIYSEWKNDDDPNWTEVGNNFASIHYTNKKNSSDDWRLYANMMYQVGSYNFLNYIKNDVLVHPNTNNDWTPMKEVENLSKYFKLNFYPQLQNYLPKIKKWFQDWSVWNENDWWPSSYENTTDENRNIIDQIKKYPSIDFVANLYASGTYLYDFETNKFNYTNDVISPYEIIAGEDYIFDFEKFINSTNKNFSWTKLEFSPISKLGAKLIRDSKNPKKIIYQPNKEKISEIDEFDITIIPDNFASKPQNYVPAYKWKIKVRQVINLPVVSWYQDFDSDLSFDEALNKLNTLKPIYKQLSDLKMKSAFSTDKPSIINSSFKFVAPNDGQYIFQNLWDDSIEIKVNNQEVFKEDNWSENKFKTTFSKKMTKGEVIDFSVSVFNKSGIGSLMMNVLLENEIIDLTKYTLLPNIKISNNTNNLLDLVNKKEYQYQKRTIDYTEFGNVSKWFNAISFDYAIDSSKWKFKWISDRGDYTDESADSFVKDLNKSYIENWSRQMKFSLDFENVEKISSIVFGNAFDHYYDGRPTEMILKGIEENGNEVLIYNGKYGNQFNDRQHNFSIFNFNKTYNLKKLIVEFNNNEQEYITIKWIQISDKKYIEPGNSFSLNNPLFKFKGNWEYKENNLNENISNLNNVSVVSNNSNEYIDFELIAQGFQIVGLKNTDNALFDVYVNDKLVGENISTFSTDRKYNQSLFTFTTQGNTNEKMKIRIIHKNNKKLYINYISTFGKDTKLQKIS